MSRQQQNIDKEQQKLASSLQIEEAEGGGGKKDEEKQRKGKEGKRRERKGRERKGRERKGRRGKKLQSLIQHDLHLWHRANLIGCASSYSSLRSFCGYLLILGSHCNYPLFVCFSLSLIQRPVDLPTTSLSMSNPIGSNSFAAVNRCRPVDTAPQ